jgi:hypothetical protein
MGPFLLGILLADQPLVGCSAGGVHLRGEAPGPPASVSRLVCRWEIDLREGFAMLRRFLRYTAAPLVVVTLLAATPAWGSSVTGVSTDHEGEVPILFDALIMRPMGLAAMCAGFGVFAVGAPIMAVTRPTDMYKPWNALVVGPARFTFVDPLGFHPDRVDSEARGTVR